MYKAQYPVNVIVDEGIVKFFETFYKTSDTPGDHQNYVNMFTEDATVIMGSKMSRGESGTIEPPARRYLSITNTYPEILNMRQGLWAHVSSRQHTISKIFPFGSHSQELMIYGVVAYELKNGISATVEWAGRAILVKDTKWRMSFYQVYLVSILLSFQSWAHGLSP